MERFRHVQGTNLQIVQVGRYLIIFNNIFNGNAMINEDIKYVDVHVKDSV